MAKYFLTNKAVEDLSKIWDYTCAVWSENQADKYYKLLIQDCQEISKKPEIGKKYPEISNKILGFRANKHTIFYIVNSPNEIEILRILYESMDLKNRIDE